MVLIRRFAIYGGAALLALAVVVGLVLDARVRAYLRGPALEGMRILAAPTVIAPDTFPERGALARKLERLGYTVAHDAPPVAGQYRVSAAGVELAQREGVLPWAPGPRRVQVLLGRDGVTGLRGLDGQGDPTSLELGGEDLATGGPEQARLQGGGQVPRMCRDAVLAAEDRHFFVHPGIDPIAMMRALMVNVRAKGRRQGGSTLTQQLVKNTFLSPQRTIMRKLREAALALLLELHTTKEDILSRYLASVYLGTDGGLPVHGLAQAAAVHLGRPVDQLTVGECALLAGMIRSPNRLAPRRHAAAARARRDDVLGLMAEAGFIDQDTAAAARRLPVSPGPPRPRPVGALYVADQVRRELGRILPRDVADSPGLSIFTSIDPDAQREAEQAVRRGLDALDRHRGRESDRLEAALVSLDVATGRVRALVGGRDYRSSALDRVVNMRRQPGSTFKPFVYLTALDPARRNPPYTVATMLDDEPYEVDLDDRVWRPVNYDDDYRGRVLLEDAIAYSLNSATVRVSQDLGVDAVIETAHALGITSPLPAVPALALGAGEVSLLELTGAYGVFASGGIRRPPELITAVVSSSGEMLYTRAPEETRVLDPAVAYLITYLLERVVDVGTGRGVRAGVEGAVAGKTGTTDDTRDAWFVGYTPQAVTGVWVGYDRARSTGLTGARGAIPIWTEFMGATAGPRPAPSFPVPDGIVWVDVDPTTGLLATPDCPGEPYRVPALAAAVPAPCDQHRPTWVAVGTGVQEAQRAVESVGRTVGGWFRSLFGR